MVKEMFGKGTFVTIKPGDVEQVRITDLRQESVEEIADGLGSLFGMDVTIK